MFLWNFLIKKMYRKDLSIPLSKAFDTVNHNIHLEKLTNYGIENFNLAWFKNYLSNRKQYFAHTERKTDLKRITCVVPQGSIWAYF